MIIIIVFTLNGYILLSSRLNDITSIRVTGIITVIIIIIIIIMKSISACFVYYSLLVLTM
jgi:hypothetical protein